MNQETYSKVIEAITEVWDHCANIDQTADYVIEIIQEQERLACESAPSATKFFDVISDPATGEYAQAASADERAAFVDWLSSSYHLAYNREEAEKLWRLNHVSALAWKERARLSGVPADRFCQECDGSGWDGESRDIFCPRCKGSGLPVFPAVSELQRQKIIGEFLKRTGQYVTNDASRQAPIDEAVCAALMAVSLPKLSAGDVVMVPHELAERLSDALGRFTSDEGWQQADMDTSDEFAAMLKAETIPKSIATKKESK